MDCPYWFSDEASSLFTLKFGSNAALCIPRGVCIKKCGPEKLGCAYTGSCTSQTCFKSASTGCPAELTRVTHYGPGSIVIVGDISTNGNREQVFPPFESRFLEDCIGDGRQFSFERTIENCSFPLVHPVDRIVVADGRIGRGNAQCRAACETYFNKSVEIVMVWNSKCTYCKTAEADPYIDLANKDICIPRGLCRRECGSPHAGCIYSGTCRSQFCFSAIDSRQPARVLRAGISVQQGSDIFLAFFDNDTRVDTFDPPAFAELSISIDSNPNSIGPTSVPCTATVTSSPSPLPASSETTQPSLTASMQPSASSAPTLSEKSESNPWPWLGPVVAAIVTGFFGIIIALIKCYGQRHGRVTIVRRSSAVKVTPEVHEGV